ncbi:MAG TPA: hypothetical protein ENI72_03565, partial [Rhodospirillales bacterium]|nr:hypothetical protein [Rhodospirillales bacterium]
MDKQTEMKSISLPVEGMTCATCAGRIEKVLSKQDGVSEAVVNLAMEQADVTYDSESIDVAGISEAIRKAGFKVPDQSVEIAIEGMTCASCVGRVEKALGALDGVVSALVNLGSERATVTFRPGSMGAADLVAAIIKTGYGAKIVTGEQDDGKEEQELARRSRADLTVFAVASILTVPLVAQMIAEVLGFDWTISPLVQLALATPVQFWAGARFYRAAWGALRAFSGNMDL